MSNEPAVAPEMKPMVEISYPTRQELYDRALELIQELRPEGHCGEPNPIAGKLFELDFCVRSLVPASSPVAPADNGEFTFTWTIAEQSFSVIWNKTSGDEVMAQSSSMSTFLKCMSQMMKIAGKDTEFEIKEPVAPTVGVSARIAEIDMRRGFSLWLSREQWGFVCDGLIEHAATLRKRKGINPESTADETVRQVEEVKRLIGATAQHLSLPSADGWVKGFNAGIDAVIAARCDWNYFPVDMDNIAKLKRLRPPAAEEGREAL